MRQTFRRIISLSKEISQSQEIIKTRGNPDFLAILNSYPEFAEGAKRHERTKRGRPSNNPSPNEVEYLVYLVENLYTDKGKPYTRDDRRKLKNLLNRAAEGADFFDPVKAKHWIDMFSALDYELHIFSRWDGGGFSDFFTNYISFYSKLNTKKIVPFYARWIKEIAAMYTVYLNETFSEFEETRDLLESALKEGMAQNFSERTLYYETETVKHHLMYDIFMACEKNKEAVIFKLCEYIRENPGEFVYESGGLNSRFRRYYCTLKEMIRWIERQNVQPIADRALMKIFSDDGVDYDLKDRNIRTLEAQLFDTLLKYCRKINVGKYPVNGVYPGEYFPLDEEKELYMLEFLVQKGASFDENNNSEVVIEIAQNPYVRTRTVEEVIDCAVKFLRLFIMMIVIDQEMNEENNDYEQPQPEYVINRINQIMKRLGLLPLPTYAVNSYNEKSFMDFCVVKCIEESFYEED